MSKIEDYSNGRGVYQGDLKYGRTVNGATFKVVDGKKEHYRDVPSHIKEGVEQNPPAYCMPEVQPRDPEVWRKDSSVDFFKRGVNSRQLMHELVVQELVDTYKHVKNQLQKKSNIRLKVGKKVI